MLPGRMNQSGMLPGRMNQSGMLPGRMNQPGMLPGRMNQPGMLPGRMNQPGMLPGRMNQSGMLPGRMNQSGMLVSGCWLHCFSLCCSAPSFPLTLKSGLWCKVFQSDFHSESLVARTQYCSHLGQFHFVQYASCCCFVCETKWQYIMHLLSK